MTPETSPESPRVKWPRWAGIIAKILDWITGFFLNMGAVLLTAMTLVIIWQVIARYNPHFVASWTEEVASLLLVWFGLTGAAVGIRKEIHIGVEFIYALFPRPAQRVLSIFTGALVLCFSVFLFFEGIALAKGCWDIHMSATQLSRGIFVYLAIPTAAILMIIFALEMIIRQFQDGGKQE
jgi:TRAP-type C4-dicarboxylate transport system permease small subunit